jgi:hypothetical protein
MRANTASRKGWKDSLLDAQFAKVLAWSNACPARRKEMRRVEQAKEIRSVYWHVPLREKTAKPETYREFFVQTSGPENCLQRGVWHS